MKPLQKRYQYLQYFRKAIQQGNFPIGIIVYYGPDDQTVTKIIAAVLPDDQTNPMVKNWFGENVAQNSETIAAIGEFFQEMQVKKVVMTEGIVGCPHEEGVDFPLGEKCSECSFWAEA